MLRLLYSPQDTKPAALTSHSAAHDDHAHVMSSRKHAGVALAAHRTTGSDVIAQACNTYQLDARQ